MWNAHGVSRHSLRFQSNKISNIDMIIRTNGVIMFKPIQNEIMCSITFCTRYIYHNITLIPGPFC